MKNQYLIICILMCLLTVSCTITYEVYTVTPAEYENIKDSIESEIEIRHFDEYPWLYTTPVYFSYSYGWPYYYSYYDPFYYTGYYGYSYYGYYDPWYGFYDPYYSHYWHSYHHYTYYGYSPRSKKPRNSYVYNSSLNTNKQSNSVVANRVKGKQSPINKVKNKSIAQQRPNISPTSSRVTNKPVQKQTYTRVHKPIEQKQKTPTYQRTTRSQTYTKPTQTRTRSTYTKPAQTRTRSTYTKPTQTRNSSPTYQRTTQPRSSYSTPSRSSSQSRSSYSKPSRSSSSPTRSSSPASNRVRGK